MTPKTPLHFSGLTDQEVAELRAKHGFNQLTPPPRESLWKLFFSKFLDPVIGILILAALISLLTGGLVESLGVLLAILLSTGISFLNEYRAGKAFDILNQTDDQLQFKVIRNGTFCSVSRKELVPGDVIFVERGEEIPADGTVLQSINFEVDQSKFTGEPEPVIKTSKDSPAFAQYNSNVTYPADHLLRGSAVLEGSAYFQVTATGGATEIGRTAQAASEITNTVTPLQKQLNKLGKVIATIGITLSLTLLAILLIQAVNAGTLPGNPLHWFGGAHLAQVLAFFMIAVTLIVVAVPEGLPMSVTLSLAYSMKRMAASNCLIRKLHACETIGAASCICTDKTGTLTMNQMRVAGFHFPASTNHHRAVYEAFAANSTANLSPDESGVMTTLGNPTEGALLHFLHAKGVDYNEIRSGFQLERQWPFTTELKFMATLGQSPELDGQKVLHLKGAPEVILAQCNKILSAGGIINLDPQNKEELTQAFKNEQAKGHRTLGFAFRPVEIAPENIADAAQEAVFLGFVSIADPVRPEVKAAIESCRNAGIEVKIVTGDTSATAGEIGRQIGIWEHASEAGNHLIEGVDFDKLPEKETMELVGDLRIIARSRPNDKLKLVRALQKQGRVVAVTGDGTNDAPALHHADVGIAMGQTGTAIAREAADIILLDDSFQSIVNAVLWGRSLYLNIQRFLIFQLIINLAAVGIALAGPFLGVALPLTVIQMLWINLIMDTFAALALATEPPTQEVMKQPPRNPDAFIVTKAMAMQIFATSLFLIVVFFFFAWQFRTDGSLNARELTLIFSGFVLFQFWNLLNIRLYGTTKSIFSTFCDNPVFTMIALLILGGQILITQFGGRIFRTTPLSFTEWAVLLAATSILLWAGEVFRLFKRIKERI